MSESLQPIINNECKNELIKIGYSFDENENVYSSGNLPPLTNLSIPIYNQGKYFYDPKNHASPFDLFQQYKEASK
jgi:hypothetical protein